MKTVDQEPRDKYFEPAEKKAEVLQIERDGEVIAKGIYIPEAMTAFHDSGAEAVSYKDTGVFILFAKSRAFPAEGKCAKFVDADGRTVRDIIFQSRNAAAQFVLGDAGSTNCWKNRGEYMIYQLTRL